VRTYQHQGAHIIMIFSPFRDLLQQQWNTHSLFRAAQDSLKRPPYAK
jgi:hypothetical protein